MIIDKHCINIQFHTDTWTLIVSDLDFRRMFALDFLFPLRYAS